MKEEEWSSTTNSDGTERYSLPPILLDLPFSAKNADHREDMLKLLKQDVDDMRAGLEDYKKMCTFYQGKQVGKLVSLLGIAEQLGEAGFADEIVELLKGKLQVLFEAKTLHGCIEAKTGVFGYDSRWRMLIGYPTRLNHSSDAAALSNHRDSYGYFARAIAVIAKSEPAWLSQWGSQVDLLV
jgi:endoglucanase Acf2